MRLKIYLDVCALCRPYDDQSYLRIKLETVAVKIILSKVKVEAIRYMTLPQQKIVDSIKRHKKWQKSLNKEEFLNKIFGP